VFFIIPFPFGSMLQFLRRLSIIIIEDAILHPLYPVVVWLVIACSKGYIPTIFHVNTLLQIVSDIASVKVLDNFVHPDNGAQQEVICVCVILIHVLLRYSFIYFLICCVVCCTLYFQTTITLFDSLPKCLDAFEASLVKALLVRASFGGLKGDVIMLRRAAVRAHLFTKQK